MTTVTREVKPQETGSERPVATAAPTSNERPSWLPDNFKNEEQFVESYKELQGTLTRLRQETASAKKGDDPHPVPEARPDQVKPEDKPAEAPKAEEAKTEEKPAEETPKTDDKAEAEVAEKLEADGIDVDGMSKEFWDTGDLSEENKTKLTSALDKEFGEGKGEGLLADYMESKRLAREYTEMKTYEPLGGKAEGDKMIAWAKSGGVTPAQAAAINTLWSSNTVESQVEGSRLLRQYYDNANGSAPKVVLDGGEATASRDVYTSTHEVTNDMADPRYRTDPVYRQRVAEKIARSKY